MSAQKFLRAFAADESGATAIEYGLIASLIVVLVIAVMQSVSSGTISMYAEIVDAMT
jgi:pilus assembly protein Flp/PilA